MSETNPNQLRISATNPSGSRSETQSQPDMKTNGVSGRGTNQNVILNIQTLLYPKSSWFFSYFGLIYFMTMLILKTIEYTTFCSIYATRVQAFWLLNGYIFFAVMATWSFLFVYFNSSQPVPTKFKLSPEERRLIDPFLPSLLHPTANGHLRRMAKDRGVRTVNRSHCVNYCETCNLIKPDRTHHCQRCNSCILRMDHHCPFFNRCIEYRLHKGFLLSLLYSGLACLYTFITQIIMQSNTDISINIYLYIFMISSLFCDVCGGLCLMLFFINQMYKACRNETSLPFTYVFTDISDDSYDLGSIRENLREVLGSMHLWLLPTPAPGDGVSWRTKKTMSSPKDSAFV